ncbi:MAG TPA: hypothetical protein VGM86_11135 [Thermoanaerobaculia bacterium]|jgi:hypothetical protein
MLGQALRIAVAGGLFISSVLAAEPLKDLQDKLASARSDQPIRVKVDVALEHQGKAPLHLNDVKEHGRVIVVAGPRGVEIREQKRIGSSTYLSLWRSPRKTGPGEAAVPMVEDEEAMMLIDPAGWLSPFLSGSTLVEDQAVTWEGQPARLLVIRPSQLPAENTAEKASTKDEPKPVVVEGKIWLGADGLPLALEATTELRLPAFTMTQHQTLTFQQIGGRLLVARSTAAFSGTALLALRGTDVKTMKVTAD